MKIITQIWNNKIIRIVICSIIYAVGFQIFIVPADILSTGFTGIAQIIQVFTINISFLDYSMIYFLINIPIFILAYMKLGYRFATYTVFSVITVSIITNLMSGFDISLTSDPILNSIFGGVITGFSVGVLLKDGTSLGGTDIIGLYLLKEKNINFSLMNNILNSIIVVCSMFILVWKLDYILW